MPKFCSPSPAMVTSVYEQNIERDAKQQTSRQITHSISGVSINIRVFYNNAISFSFYFSSERNCILVAT